MIKKGFVLIELIIVVAIVGILAAIIVPAIQNKVHPRQRVIQSTTERHLILDCTERTN